MIKEKKEGGKRNTKWREEKEEKVGGRRRVRSEKERGKGEKKSEEKEG